MFLTKHTGYVPNLTFPKFKNNKTTNQMTTGQVPNLAFSSSKIKPLILIAQVDQPIRYSSCSRLHASLPSDETQVLTHCQKIWSNMILLANYIIANYNHSPKKKENYKLYILVAWLAGMATRFGGLLVSCGGLRRFVCRSLARLLCRMSWDLVTLGKWKHSQTLACWRYRYS